MVGWFYGFFASLGVLAFLIYTGIVWASGLLVIPVTTVGGVAAGLQNTG
mgnify:CR=1 FL=1